jgi:HNH endonuclease
MPKKYSFVLDADGKQLDPTIEQNAWRLVRQKKACLVSKFPMVIQLNKVVENPNQDEIRCGIDDGTNHVGLALVQKCQTRNKVLFKGVIEQRKDVKHLMDVRRGYRRYHRYHKWYRPPRFNNRASSKRSGRLPPSIKQRKQAIIRVIDRLCKWIHISNYWLEDVKIDIRALTDGFKPYKWQYQKSNRLDNNLRLAAIYRDDCRCMECGKENTRFEVHHITPRSKDGADTISNLITLCPEYHARTFGREEQFADRYYSLIRSAGNIRGLADAQRVMQGKTWLREQLTQRGELFLTTGADTANKRDDWNIVKTHSNDAVCITDLEPENIDIEEWTIMPMRRKSKACTEQVCGFRHRDLVTYTYRNGETHTGYVTALYPDKNQLNFKSPTKHCKRVNALKTKLLWRFNKIYWLKCS